MNENIRKLNDTLSAIMDESMPRPVGMEDWAYRDMPKTREDFFDMFIKILGADNIKWITFAMYLHDGVTYKRGQFWLSPEGIKRASEYTNRPRQ